MRSTFAFIGFFLSFSVFAAQGFHFQPTNITNCISPAYSLSVAQGGSAIGQMVLNNQDAMGVTVISTCTPALAFTFTNGSPNVVPSSNTTTNPLQFYVPPGAASTPVTVPLPVGAGKYAWVRTDGTAGAACTSGDVIFNFW